MPLECTLKLFLPAGWGRALFMGRSPGGVPGAACCCVLHVDSGAADPPRSKLPCGASLLDGVECTWWVGAPNSDGEACLESIVGQQWYQTTPIIGTDYCTTIGPHHIRAKMIQGNCWMTLFHNNDLGSH
jgi:hypothetical protein